MLPPLLLKIRDAFTESPFERRVFAVGGWVRDSLLNGEGGDDLDLVVEGDATKAATLLVQLGLSRLPPQIYARFGTAMVMIDGARIEFASARAESYSPESRKPDVAAASLEEDALRRDFTVNSLLLDLWSGEVVDTLGLGVPDLEAGILRTPRDPVITFRDDPHRMLRAVRFKHRLGFDYHPDLAAAIRAESHRLSIISGERIRDEFVKILDRPSAPEALQDLLDLELLKEFIPELCEGVGVPQGSYHHLDVWGHTVLTVKNAGSSDLMVSLAALLHDVAKPRTRFIDDKGDTRFFGHEVVGADMAREILDRLKFSRSDIDRVAKLVASHMRLGSFPKITRPIARRILRDLGEDWQRLFALALADSKSHKPGTPSLDVQGMWEFVAKVSEEEPEDRWHSPLTGSEIMDLLSLTPGPKVGRVKQALSDLVIEGRLDPQDKEGAKRSAVDLVLNLPPE